MRRSGAAFIVAVLLVGCSDRSIVTPQEPDEADVALLSELRQLGIRGTVAITDFVIVDGAPPNSTGRSLLLPVAQRQQLRKALQADPEAAGRVGGALALAAEVEDPEQLDPDNNTPLADLAGRVSPSRLNGPSPVQTQIRFTNRFISLDDSGNSFVVQTGDVLETFINPRAKAGGHYHGGPGIDLEVRKPLRVGVMEPESGSFSAGIWSSVWQAPEFAQEVLFEFKVRETSGPNAGDVNVFSSFNWYATRQSGFVRLPPNDALYVRTGGTTSHPEDFNDWGESDIVARLQQFAMRYNALTQDRVSINDIGLMFGGRFDAGRQVGSSWVPCDASHAGTCWGFSHGEHRGSEADVRPVDRVSASRRQKFLDLAELAFASVHQEASHLHVRDRFSPFNR